MITVYAKYASGHLETLTVRGHANFDKKGRDIVCAAVSLASFGLLNSLDEKKAEINIEENEINVEVIEFDEKINNYFELYIIQIKTIAESFKDNVQLLEIGRSKNHDEI